MLKDRTEILRGLREILITADSDKAAAADACTEETRLTEDLGFTSIDLLYLVIMIEEQFHVRFEHVTLSSFRTIGDVIDYLQGAKAQ